MIKIVDLAGPATTRAAGRLRAHRGRYVESYDHRTRAGEPLRLVTTRDPERALRFPSVAEAHALWTMSYGKRPWDGEPNRPLTAFTIAVLPLENEEEDGDAGD